MTGYLIRRLLQMMGVLIISSMLIYFFLYLAPGGPLAELQMAGDRSERVSEQQLNRMKEYLGLHRGPLWGYTAWLTGEDWLDNVGRADLQRSSCQRQPTMCSKGAIRGDFGASWKVARGSTVAFVIQSRIINTILLMTTSVVLSLIVAIPIGIYSAVNQYSRSDYALTSFAFFGQAMPVFWFGIMMILLFGGNQSLIYDISQGVVPYLPTGNVNMVRPAMPGSLQAMLGASPGSWMDTMIHLIMPALVLSLLYMAQWSRFVRAAMLDVLRQDYVRTARSKGLTERVVTYKHALRNALIPLITIVVFQLPNIFSGAVITETVFNWVGMGQLFINALMSNDYPVAMAFLFITAVLTVIATLIRDVIYTIIDPRIRFS